MNVRHPELTAETATPRRLESYGLARRGAIVAAMAAVALTSPHAQSVAEERPSAEGAIEAEDSPIETTAEDSNNERIPDGESQFVQSVYYGDETLTFEDSGEAIGHVTVETAVFCDLNEWDFNVSLETAGDSGLRFGGHLAPHGGPGPDQEEYTGIGHRTLELSEIGQATASIYSLPPVAVYDFIVLEEFEEYHTVTGYRPSFMISSPSFSEICIDNDNGSSEYDDAPQDDSEQEDGGEPTEEPTQDHVSVDEDSDHEAVAPDEGNDQNRGSENATPGYESTGPELPATGSRLRSLVLVGLTSIAIGSTALRRRLQKNLN